jgi:RAT1-interacting protein
MQYWGKSRSSPPSGARLSKPFLGYKFETLSTLPRPWGETSREYIENRAKEIVNNKEQYCSVVRTGFGKTVVCLGGEVDASMKLFP